MIHEIILPRLGTNMDEGVIAEWKKSEGEAVTRGEPVLMVETSKAIFEVEAENDGFLGKILHPEGARVRFAEPVGLLTEEPGEDLAAYFDGAAKRMAAPRRHHEIKREELMDDAAPAATAGPAGRVRATPAARRLMRESGLSPAVVAGTAGQATIDSETVRRLGGRATLAVYGAGLGARQVMELLKFYPGVSVMGFFDDNPEMKGREVLGHAVIGGWEDFMERASAGEIESVVISLHSEHRRKVYEKIRAQCPSVDLKPLVDGRAIISEGVKVSPGAFIEAGSVIGPDTFIGEDVIVDLGATVCHDCWIGADSHLSPGCAISGVVRVEGNVLIGVGAAVNSQVTIGANSVITPGSAVVTDVPPDVVVSGNPARVIGRSFRGRG